MPKQSSDYRVSIFGSGGVGKSSIVQRFLKGTFNETYVPTVEDTYSMVIGCGKNNVCTLQIIDTTGSHQFPAMQRLSAAKGNAFVLVYSVTCKQTLQELKPVFDLIREVKGASGREDDLPIILVGNKIDEEKERQLTTEQGNLTASQWSIEAFMETSARTGYNIKETFQKLVSMERKRNLNLSLYENNSDEKRSSKKCCLL